MLSERTESIFVSECHSRDEFSVRRSSVCVAGPPRRVPGGEGDGVWEEGVHLAVPDLQPPARPPGTAVSQSADRSDTHRVSLSVPRRVD